jgi:tripartite-type tricarboxylate transporter receptor subunit TctC
LIQKIRATPEWIDFMEKGAFNQTFMAGADFEKWVASAETIHHGLMQEAGFLAKK